MSVKETVETLMQKKLSFFFADISGVPKIACLVNFFICVVFGSLSYTIYPPYPATPSLWTLIFRMNGQYLIIFSNIFLSVVLIIYYMTQESERFSYFGRDSRSAITLGCAVAVAALFVEVGLHYVWFNYFVEFIQAQAKNPSRTLLPLSVEGETAPFAGASAGLLILAKEFPVAISRVMFERNHSNSKNDP
jgi:hypothetical protein